MLMRAVDSYLAVRRAVGFELEAPEWLLRSYARFGTKQGDTHVQAQTVIDWASDAPSPGQRRHRLHTVIRLARHLHAEDPQHELPPGDVFGGRPSRRVPYIYSPDEIRQLVQAAVELGSAGTLVPYAFATLFSLLAATGLRIREALRLKLDDLTPDGLVIRETKFKKSRLVPLHPTAQAGLDRYLTRRRRVGGMSDRLFLSPRGYPLRYNKVNATFLRLVRALGLHPGPGKRGPRLHCLRHTFAVRALEASPEGRDRIGQHMLALSTYLGHRALSDTYWYLEATPHLMQDIALKAEVAFVKGGVS